MPLTPKFNKFSTASPVVATFDFVDIAENTGVVRYFGIHSKEQTTDQYSLIRNTVASNDRELVTAGADADFDIDFDTSVFALARTAKGTAYVNISGFAETSSGTQTLIITATVRHWDGSTETDIGSAISETISIGPTNTLQKRLLLKIVLTDKIFKVGDTLRLNIVGTADGGTGSTGFGHDPKERAAANLTTISTSLEFFMPFELQL